MALRAHLLPLLVTALAFVAPQAVCAQSGQEKIVQEKLERSGTLEYIPAGKVFSTDATFGGKQAAVRPFGFMGRTANSKSGDGAYHSRLFNDGRGSFRTDRFAAQKASVADRQALPQANNTYATRTVDVREDRATGRSLDSQAYVNSGKPFLVPGKRQDTIDDLRKQKNLTIDQVREILNKNR